MADLPTERVTTTRVFLIGRVYYAEPISVLKYRDRGIKTTKDYEILFDYFSTKAAHIELESELTSETFIATISKCKNFIYLEENLA